MRPRDTGTRRRAFDIGVAMMWLIPGIVLAGCATAEQMEAARAQLQRAQGAYSQAKADPQVQAYAQLSLIDAQKTLEAAGETSNVHEIQHRAYLAERKSQTAVSLGQARKLEQDTQALSKETSVVLLEKRQRETKLALAELDQARRDNEARARQIEQARVQLDAQSREIAARAQETEQARATAEARAREVEQARATAEARAREAEQARMQAEADARAAVQARQQAEQARLQAETARGQAEVLTRELADLKARQTERGIELTMGDVLFAIGKAELAPGAQRSLAKLAEFLQKHPKRGMVIEGHTDSTGSEEFNMTLSRQRAESVKSVLVARGVSDTRVVTRGYGFTYPVAPNDTALGRQQNRRVELIVLDEGVDPEGAATR